MTPAELRTSNLKRRAIKRFVSIKTLRFDRLQRAGLIGAPAGRPTLDPGTAQTIRQRLENIAAAVQK